MNPRARWTDRAGRWLGENPRWVVFIGFLFYCVGGGVWLMLPAAVGLLALADRLAAPEPVAWIAISIVWYPIMIAPLLALNVLRDGVPVREALLDFTIRLPSAVGAWIRPTRAGLTEPPRVHQPPLAREPEAEGDEGGPVHGDHPRAPADEPLNVR